MQVELPINRQLPVKAVMINLIAIKELFAPGRSTFLSDIADVILEVKFKVVSSSFGKAPNPYPFIRQNSGGVEEGVPRCRQIAICSVRTLCISRPNLSTPQNAGDV